MFLLLPCRLLIRCAKPHETHTNTHITHSKTNKFVSRITTCRTNNIGHTLDAAYILRVKMETNPPDPYSRCTCLMWIAPPSCIPPGSAFLFLGFPCLPRQHILRTKLGSLDACESSIYGWPSTSPSSWYIIWSFYHTRTHTHIHYIESWIYIRY